MRRSNFVLGIGASLGAHVALIAWLMGGASRTAPSPTPRPVSPVQISSVDPDQTVPLQPPAPPPAPPAPAPEPAQAAREETVPPPPDTSLERVAQPPPAPRGAPGRETRERAPAPAPAVPTAAPIERAAADPVTAPLPAATPGPDSVEGEDALADAEPAPASSSRGGEGDPVPPLRVHWRDARELIAVARALGMRLAAVDGGGEILGEIALADEPQLKEWAGLPYGYSNRVRMLSPSIFASGLAEEPGITEIWVFVPADRDRTMVEAQKEAVRRAGATLDDVASVDGRFVRAANGSYRLDITNVRMKGTGRG